MTPTDQAQQDEDANLRKIVAQLHVNLGHPSNDALARDIRLSGGSDDAIQAALKVRSFVCERLTEPSLVPAASLRRWTEFGQCVAFDLFMFADITGENGMFLDMLDMDSHYQVVFPVADKNPLTVFYRFFLGWCLTLGVPECLWIDLRGEFESSFSELAEQIGCRLLPAASVLPTQNAPCERARGAWKYRARRLVDQFSIKWNDSSTKLCSPRQGVLGRSLRLPFHLPSRASQLASHQRHRVIIVVSPCWLKHRDRSSAPSTIRLSVVLSCPVPEVPIMLRRRFVLQSDIRSCIGVETTSERSQWSMRWLGPGIVIGHESRANVWISHHTSDHSTASAVATHTGFSVTGGDRHVHWWFNFAAPAVV